MRDGQGVSIKITWVSPLLKVVCNEYITLVIDSRILTLQLLCLYVPYLEGISSVLESHF